MSTLVEQASDHARVLDSPPALAACLCPGVSQNSSQIAERSLSQPLLTAHVDLSGVASIVLLTQRERSSGCERSCHKRA